MRNLNVYLIAIMLVGLFIPFVIPQPIYAASDNLTFIATHDCFLHELEPAVTHDTGQWNVEGSVIVILRPLLEFDISSIPADCIIQDAILYAYYFQTDIGTPAGRTYNVRRLLRRDFEESEATWNVYKTGSSWTTAGCGSTSTDYTLTDSASATVPAEDNWMDWNVTAQVNQAYTNSTTADFRISDNVEDDAVRHNAVFKSGEAAEAGWRPRLEVTYELPPWDEPTVTTGAITGFGETWAVGAGAITDIGDATVTQIGIDYGLTDAYGSSKTEPVYITSAQGFSLRLDGLTPATQYHWRAKAYNGEWGYGSDAVFHTSGSDTLYEYWNTADDADVDIYGNNWFGQTFTTGATVPHTVTQVRVRLFRVGSPGTLTAQIHRTSAGVPTGQHIGEGDIDADTFTTGTAGAWYTVTLDEETALESSTMYAVVLGARDGGAADYVSWRYDNANGYASGTEVTSTDGGITWSTVGANDMMFEVWGNPALRILDVKVFESLIEDSDQLFLFSYQVIPPTAYDDELPISYFHTQLLVGSSLEAQGKLLAWGYKPGGFYLSADNALPWDSNLTAIKITGLTGGDFAGDEAEYILTSTDWVGEDLYVLDDWVIATANAMGTWYGVTLTGANDVGEAMLTPDGGLLFTIGIPGLEGIRPSLFSITPVTEVPEKKTHDTSYADSLLGGLGGKWVDAVDDIGELIGVSGEFVGGSIWAYIIVLGISVVGVGVGNPVVSLICAGLPLAFIGGALGAVPLIYILLPVFLLGVWAIMKLTHQV